MSFKISAQTFPNKLYQRISYIFDARKGVRIACFKYQKNMLCFFSDEYAFETNISLDFTFPGFTLLENDQKCTFYVILWDYMGPLEIRQGAANKFFLPNFKQTVFSHFFYSEETQNRS